MPKKSAVRTQPQLVAENADLRARLDEAEETLRAIRSGEVDAIVVSGAGGEETFTFQSAREQLAAADRSRLALLSILEDQKQTEQALRRSEEALRDRVAALQAVAEIDQQITAATEANSILELVCRRAAELVHAPKSAIVTRTAAKEMAISASYGFSDEAGVSAEFAHVQHMGGMNLSVLETREALTLNDIAADSPVMSKTMAGEGIRALAIVPLVAAEAANGALIVVASNPAPVAGR